MEDGIFFTTTADGKKRYTEYFKRMVRRDHDSGLSNKELAIKYNTTPFNVWNWCKGRKSRSRKSSKIVLAKSCNCSKAGYKLVKYNWFLKFLGY